MGKILVFGKLLAFFVLVKDGDGIFRRTTTTTTTTEKPYVFEGVDYDQMPQEWQEEHSDCFAEFIRCIRARTYFTPVCAYNKWTKYYEDFYHICDVDLYRCKGRIQYNLGVFGTDYTDGWMFYNGEELNCKYYYRRAHNSKEMDELYFHVKDPPYHSLPTPEKYLGA